MVNGMSPSISLRWRNVCVAMPLPPAGARGSQRATLPPKPAAAPTSLPDRPATNKSHFLPIAAAKNGPRRSAVGKPRTKLSRRMAATLAFFAVHDKYVRRAKAIARVPNPQQSRTSTCIAPSQPRALETLPANDVLTELARSDQEVEVANADLAMVDLSELADLAHDEVETGHEAEVSSDDSTVLLPDMLDLLMPGANNQLGPDHDLYAFELADCLAHEITGRMPPSTITSVDYLKLAARAELDLPFLPLTPYLPPL